MENLEHRCSSCIKHSLSKRDIVLDCNGNPAWKTNPLFDCKDHESYLLKKYAKLGPELN